MRFGRVAAAVAVAALAGGGALLASSSIGSAATTPVTPISLGALGMSSSSCPLPLTGTMAVKPGTTVQFKPDSILGATETLSLAYVRETASTPKPAPTVQNVPNSGLNVAFASAGTYDLSWHTVTLGALGVQLIGTTQTGKLVVNTDAQNCTVAVQVPVPSASVPAVPNSLNSTVNGVLNTAVGTVNGALSPVNNALAPLAGGVPGGSNGGGSTSGTTYKPTGPTVAQRTMPQGYGSGSGVGGTYVTGGNGGGSGSGSAVGPAGSKSGTSAASQQQIKSGGSPKTVELAADKPRSALAGWGTLIVLAAVLALSGATAFYARSYLLQPQPAKAFTS